MKAKKVLKRIAKIEALISEVKERSSASAPHIRELLGDAKAAVIRVKEAVILQASSGTAKNRPVKHSEPSSKTTPELSKPKRKLSAAGRKAIVAATKKRWATFHAAKAKPVVAKKATAKKAVVKKAPVKAAKKAPVKKVAVKKTAAKLQKTAPGPAQAGTETGAQ
jgi:hypothetical protein